MIPRPDHLSGGKPGQGLHRLVPVGDDVFTVDDESRYRNPLQNLVRHEIVIPGQDLLPFSPQPGAGRFRPASHRESIPIYIYTA